MNTQSHDSLKKLSAQDLLTFGLNDIAYLKPASVNGQDVYAIHGAERTCTETNCYTDVLIELLHSRGFEPVAGLGHLVRTDFEGDQFTFFKMPPGDIETLYGVDIHEMQPVGALPGGGCLGPGGGQRPGRRPGPRRDGVGAGNAEVVRAVVRPARQRPARGA